MGFRKILKRMISVGLTTVIFGTLMMGCGSKANVGGANSDPSKLDPVTLKMYLIGDKPKDFDEVYGKVNEIMKEKINATLDISFLPWSDMTTKYQLLFQSGENFDIIFTASSWGYYSQVATKNGFYEITDDMLKEYAPNIYENEPKDAWEQAKINDKIYMIPSDQVEYGTRVFGARGDLMKKYGIEKIENYDDLEAYMDAVSKDTESGIKVIANGGGQNLQYPYMMEKYAFGGIAGVPTPSIGFDVNDQSGNIFAYVDRPEYLEYAKKMKEFADKGYWSSDSISSKATRDEDFMAGKTATMVWNIGSVADRAQRMNKTHPEWDVQVADQTTGINRMINTYTNNGIAINSISKNPERALMAIDLLRYDKDIYDLTWYGIEGKHYKAEGNDKYTSLDGSDGFPTANVCPWGWYSQKLGRSPADEPPIVGEIKDKWEKEYTVTNPLAAFSFDDSNVKNEMAAVGNVITQYGVPIDLGMCSDVEVAVKEYKEKLNEAGFDKIYAECEKQVAEYMKQHNS